MPVVTLDNYTYPVFPGHVALELSLRPTSTWNDKTIVLFDDLVRGVNDGDIYSDNEFKLLETDKDGNIVEVIYLGAWFMVDNGYLSWSCTVPPIKDGVSYKYIRFSEWLESMRKDVECTFGILKGRFCILRYGLRIQSIKRCDQLFLTCCALHNRLLFIDGLDKNWSSGEKSNWEKEYIQHQRQPTSFAIRRLYFNKNAEHSCVSREPETLVKKCTRNIQLVESVLFVKCHYVYFKKD